MSLKIAFALAALAGVVGIGFGYFLRWIISLGKRGSMELLIKQMMLDAEVRAQKITEEAERHAREKENKVTADLKEKERELKHTEDRLVRKEELLDTRQTKLEGEETGLNKKVEDVKKAASDLEELRQTEQKKLEQIAHLSAEDARNELLRSVEKQYESDIESRIQKLEIFGNERLEKRAQDILTTAVHRLGNSVVSDVIATTVSLPSDEIKGKIIGKEGRNIRSFERATGVDVIIDDTPGTITLSCYDPVRRQIARIALENLILDGRIQPAKIEEAVQKAEAELSTIIKKKGTEAAYAARVANLDPKLLMILGRLYFRTSYGQNVLDHSVEMAHLASMLAEELGANPAVARAGALLHDIGKAVDHEVTGTHVEIGRRILQKFGVDEAVIKAMQAHHEEYPYETPESMIVQVADAVSGGRPGARRDSVEHYIKRLENLEAIANREPGVMKSYAIAAGREVRVIVKPEDITDMDARKLARDIADKIEKEMQYPGEIKVNVIRETRVIEYAR
ncbi:ribonuclease Y [Candidatus Kaiserbacteria bacterium RIFCSPHIGHO2_01_FULL_50_13]|uniref:Ribonuclease Y n=1 Tax=Candidatus Kaiserbacteria bacterium RIFCSPLOWO2_01_FULL_50_24 TaxID=1798507 RepID=A0A1F6ERI9_9BACT|nr:MAG: ribonuclease Y [Candidatus Kaiserbacteria bacterium RIFCSPHIGHO2_01_FULL_50_13]OGG76241.1 MAG: ribonuclease Y [Candidatus Kaiserbacteria bacterium RIFCSPLOWO2_01_FULL_50_24]OGG81821.1 MAG: ribonuclease Y [Candidatus Kaiserbacteria bacterium RIFCSPLOWO2_02_FULL_51_13]